MASQRALTVCRALGAEIVEPPPPPVTLDIGDDFLDVLDAELLVFHRRFDDRRDGYRPSLREWVELGEARNSRPRATSPPSSAASEPPPAFAQWLADERISALVEPTVPCVAPLRGDGYDLAGTDYDADLAHALLGLDGLPGRRAPGGVGTRSGLPVERFADRAAPAPTGSCWTRVSSCRRSSACPSRSRSS